MKKTEDSNGHGVICGSRAHLESDSIASRSLFRTILMFGFHLCVKVFGCRTIKDTQCGFKLFTRNTSRIMFKSCHIGKRHALKIYEHFTVNMNHLEVFREITKL